MDHVLVQVAMIHLILSECVISMENNDSDRLTLGFAKMNHVHSKIEQRWHDQHFVLRDEIHSRTI